MNNQKGFANIVLIVLVVVLVGALGYMTLIRKSNPVEQPQTNNLQNTQTQSAADLPKNNTTQNAPTTQPTTKPQASPTDPLADWQIYTDSKYGFEFKYPKGHELDELDLPVRTSNGVTYAGEHTIIFGIKDKSFWDMNYNDLIFFSVKFKPDIGTAEEFLQNAFPDANNDTAHSYSRGIKNGHIIKTTFAGRPAIIDVTSYLSGAYKTIYISGKDNNYYLVISQGSNAEVLSKILTTFKFTK